MSISPCLCIGAAQCIQLVQDGKYESSRQRAVICITNILPSTCSSETTTLAEMDIYICRHIHTHNMNVRWPLRANEPECWPCSTPGRRMRNVKDEESAVERWFACQPYTVSRFILVDCPQIWRHEYLRCRRVDDASSLARWLIYVVNVAVGRVCRCEEIKLVKERLSLNVLWREQNKRTTDSVNCCKKRTSEREMFEHMLTLASCIVAGTPMRRSMRDEAGVLKQTFLNEWFIKLILTI